MPLNKIHNDYAELLDRLYSKTPKAVFAAIAVSALTRGDLSNAKKEILAEWLVLHENGIIPQKPPMLVRR